MDKMWAICGLPVERLELSRIVVCGALHMLLIPSQPRLFYRKMSIARSYVSKHILFIVQNGTINI